MNNETIIAHGAALTIPFEEEAERAFQQWRERDKERPRNASRLSHLICRLVGHRIIDASSDWQPFGYSSTSFIDGERTPHEGAKQRSVWIFCGRCGEVLKSGIEFDGFVIPGNSSVP